MQTQSQDYHDGLEQAFKVCLIHIKDPQLKAAIEQERDHYLSVPVEQQTKQELDLAAIEAATAKSELLNTSLELNYINMNKLVEGIQFLEGKGISLSKKSEKTIYDPSIATAQ